MSAFRSLSLAALVALAMPSAPAAAHGGRPQTYDVLFSADAPDVLVVPSTFGFIISRDAGATWEWLCLQAMPDARGGELHSVVLLRGEVLLVSSDFGLLRGASYGCGEWSYAASALRDRFIADVVRAPGPGSEPGAIAVTSDPGTENQLFRVVDTGRDATPMGSPMPSGFLPERVRLAPADGDTIYVSGFYRDAGSAEPRAALQVSRDGGATWLEHAFALEGTERSLHVLGVDPERPERVYLVARGDAMERVRISDDAGATTRDLLVTSAAPGALERPYAFGFAPDGRAWLGNSSAGLYTTDGSSTRLVDKFVALACVVARGEQMWLCADGFPDTNGDGFALATLRYDAPRYAPTARMLLDEIARRECPDVPACDAWWPDFLRDVGRSDEVPDAGPALPDAGQPADAGSVDAGGVDAGSAAARPSSGCALGRGGVPALNWAIALCAAALARGRRKRLKTHM